MFTTYVTRVRSMTVLCTLIGERPPAILGDVRCVCTFSDSTGNVAIVVEYYTSSMCMMFFSLIARFPLKVHGSSP